MALPTFVAVGTAAEGLGDIVPGLPTGWAENDVFILAAKCRITDAINVPSGWAHVTDSPVIADTGIPSDSPELTILWRRATASESAPTLVDAGNHQVAQIVAYRGVVATGNPWDVTSASSETTSDTSGSITGDTTTVADCLVVAAIAHAVDSAAAQFSSYANTDLSSVTERIDAGTAAGSGGGVGLADGGKATAGAYGATTVTLANASAKAMLTVALKPATSGETTTGTLNATAPAATGSLTAEATSDGTLDATAPAATASITSDSHSTTTLGATAPAAVAFFEGGTGVFGQAHAVAPAAVGSLTGETGIVDAILGAVAPEAEASMAGTVFTHVPATLDASAPAAVASLSATPGSTATLGAAAPKAVAHVRADMILDPFAENGPGHFDPFDTVVG
ncbi:MAG: hypothetical protein ACRD0W_19850 [Acidimicrobiales bacterium]